MRNDSATDIRLYSVGHSNHDWSQFFELLHGAAITTLVDVRSSPFSRRLPQFSRPELEQALEQHGIIYGFLGDRLGGRPASADVYDAEGRVDYERVRRTAAFQSGLDDLCEALDRCTVAMMCSEADPLDCHRGLMIAPALVERGVAVAHLRKDGTVETMPEFEDRLLGETGVGAGLWDGLFAALISKQERAQLLAEAYRARARRVAFRSTPEARALNSSSSSEDEYQE